MKKIIYIAQSAGGVAEYLYMFFNNFKSENYENILIVSEDYKEQIQRFKSLVKKIYFVPMVREISIKSDFKAIKDIKKILKKEKPNIVYLHSSKAGALGRIALLFNTKIKILYNAHGWYFNANISNTKKKFYALIEKLLALKTDKVINISKSEYDSAINYKITKSKKMCIIENAIDFNKFEDSEKYRKETRKKYNINENQKLIGVVGRISEQKDPMTSIMAFNLVHEKYINTKFIFIGDGELKDNILNYAKKNNIQDDVIITGWVNNVEEYIPALDIAILPSKWEGFGLVLLEYMACNKPIIATKVGGIENIIKDEENGYLIKIGEYKDLSKKIEQLLENNKKIDVIIENNKKYKENYNINNLIKQHEKIFESINSD